MVKIGPPSPVLNTLDVLAQWTYAGTAFATWEVVYFFINELKPVNIDNLDLEDRQCDICTAKLADDSHPAVSLPCRHSFGRECIEHWLRPFASFEGAQPSLGASTCPVCRQVFFPEQTAFDSLHFLEARIGFWDLAYAHVGIALSETDRQARADLLQHIGSRYARGVVPFVAERSIYIQWVHLRLQIFCHDLKHQGLTPVQEHLRQGLEAIARRGSRRSAGGVRCWRDDQGSLVFDPGHSWDTTVQSGGSNERDWSEKIEESDELIDGDTEEMRFFRAMFR